MKPTENIIIDLLPLYLEGEASTDSVNMIEQYFAEHPEFANRAQNFKLNSINTADPALITEEDEMQDLKKTKRVLKLRSFIFGLAIFFSAIPFTFGDVSWAQEEGVHWLWKNYPEGALICGFIALILWGAYAWLHKRLKVVGL